MKRYSVKSGIVLLGALCFLSCSDEISNYQTTLKGITVKSEAFQYDEPLAKASYTVDPSQGFILNWTDGDVIGIYPVGGDQHAFPISSGSGSCAQFDGGSWAVRSTCTYAAYYPFSTDYYTIAQTALPVSYTGQSQTGNGSTAGLGRYDYQASAATVPESTGNINITVKHLGCFVRLQLTVPVVGTFTSLTLTSDNGQFVTAGTFDLTSATPSITGTATSASMSMSLSGVSNTAGNKVVTLYMMMAPADLSTSTITATLAGTANQSYTANFTGKNMLKGMAYSYSATMRNTSVNGHEYVDLGLPSGILWATMNVGATKSTDYGDYFAWGETSPYYEPGYAQENPQSHWKTGKSAGYSWSSYKYCNGNKDTQTKYCQDASYGYNGYTDNKTVLDASDDAATANWGDSWRMPTLAEMEELLNTDNCTWEWTQIDDVYGYKVKSKKSGYTDNFIFLPAAGFCGPFYPSNVGEDGFYWSNTLQNTEPCFAYILNFESDDCNKDFEARYRGKSVRPVYSEDPNCGITGVSLDKTNTLITVGSYETLTATVSKNAGAVNTQVEWSSSNTAVATVDHSGKVTAVSAGTATITARTVFGGFSATCTVTATPYAYVDLGLSVKWATMNVGASKPEGCGDYFAWGATEPWYEPGYAQKDQTNWKTDKSEGYSWVNAPYQTVNTTSNSSTKWTKYLGSTTSPYKDQSATDSNAIKTVLDAEDDAATMNWGGTWRIPTMVEMNELKTNCTWTWYPKNNSEFDGMSGYKVTSNKSGYTDKYIFLPAAGYRYDTNLMPVRECGLYWCSSLDTSDPYKASSLYISLSNLVSLSSSSRSFGFSVRPVCP